MQVKFNSSPEKTLSCSGKLTIYKVRELKKNLLDSVNSAADKSGQWNLDLKHVETIDLAALQVLVALKNEITKWGGQMVLSESCPGADALLATLDLTSALPRKAA